MKKRVFVEPTQKEIEERKRMYEEADALGIDLMGYDGDSNSAKERRDIRKAVVLLGTGRSVPKELQEKLIKRNAIVKKSKQA